MSTVPRHLDQQKFCPCNHNTSVRLARPTYFPAIYKSSTTLVQPIFMPYIQGPKMDWTVNDSLYHRFLKWKLKCENILDCELAMLPEAKKS